MNSMNAFKKRTYTVTQQFREIMAIAGKGRTLLRALGGKYIPANFKERIMLAVTQVNQCKYCNYFHSKQALKAGVPESEIREIAKGEFGNIPENETVALLFAEHWAETRGKPDSEAVLKLKETYGDRVAEVIIMNICLIMVGNHLGNTWESFTLRFKKDMKVNGSFLSDAAVFLSWIVLSPLALLRLLFSLILGI